MQQTTDISFEQQAASGRLTLKGVVDIFEAERLHRIALQALQNTEVASLDVDMMAVERLDVSAVQILCSLKNGLDATGRLFTISSMSPNASQALARLGIAL